MLAVFQLVCLVPFAFATVPEITPRNPRKKRKMPFKAKFDGQGWIARMLLLVWLTIISGVLTGCAEGPLWRTGKYSPWASNQWAEEERIADTLFVRKRRMTESVDLAINAPLEDQQRVAKELAEILHRDPITLLRLHAVKLLGELNCPAAIQALDEASHDRTSDIRIAAIKAWGKMPADAAIPHLQEMIGSDTNTDVRLAATRALGNFSGQKAVAAISLALDDRDPALQLRAAESLEKVTGEPLGRNISEWKKYVENVIPDLSKSSANKDIPTSNMSGKERPSVAEREVDSIFR